LVVDGDSVVGVINAEGSEYHARSVILATGGMSYPLTGSTGDGYKMAQAVGHTILEPRASLVPLVVREGWCSSLQGLALKNVSIKVTEHDKTKVVYEDFGELMMAHYGLSGPVALSASAHMSKIDKIHYDFYIDLKPALSEEKLDARILRDFEKYNQKNFDNSLQDLLPSRLISVVVKISKIPPETKVNQITRGQRLDLIKALKALKLEVIGFRPIEEAVVTSGGIKVSEIDPRSMESRIIRNLHFAGEVIDVDAYTGGFNLQIAFSTGRAAGKGVLEE
ncbi:MAG: aminoacetone oxidase family FAD-binding enzyme, partial [Oscillospiraceae bacterium]